MKINFEKSMKIASELLSYCHNHGAAEFHLDIKLDSDKTIYLIKADALNLTESERERLDRLLNAPRQREVEQDYWELIGETEDSCELTLIGMLTDEAVVKYEDRILTIEITRKA